MDTQAVLYLAGAGAGLYFIVRYLFSADTRVEERRRRAIQLSQWTQGNGLPILSRLLECYSVGDYSGALSSLQEASRILSDPDESKAVVDRFLKLQLDKRAQSAEGREDILSYLETRFGVKISREAVEAVVAQVKDVK